VPPPSAGPSPEPAQYAAVTAVATMTVERPIVETAPSVPPPFAASVPEQPPAPSDYDYDPGPPPFAEVPSDENFDPHLAALDDEAVPNDPGPSARDLLIKELGASIVDEIQNTD
jgi:hypothetical protein